MANLTKQDVPFTHALISLRSGKHCAVVLVVGTETKDSTPQARSSQERCVEWIERHLRVFLIKNGYLNENRYSSAGFLRLALDFWGKHLRFVCIS